MFKYIYTKGSGSLEKTLSTSNSIGLCLLHSAIIYGDLQNGLLTDYC